DLGMLARGDVVLALSNSGETDEVLAILPPLKRLGVPIVLLTGAPGSTLARQCEVVLDVSVAEEACPMNLAPTSSTTAALAMGDALAMALLELRGLRPEDYAALHPRGTLGWRALFRVADLMHGGDTLPSVRDDASIKDAVEEMTRKRARTAAVGATLHSCGMTTVVDADGRLLGVITDGDLRRMQLAGSPMTDARAGEAATRSPKTIAADGAPGAVGSRRHQRGSENQGRRSGRGDERRALAAARRAGADVPAGRPHEPPQSHRARVSEGSLLDDPRRGGRPRPEDQERR